MPNGDFNLQEAPSSPVDEKGKLDSAVLKLLKDADWRINGEGKTLDERLRQPAPTSENIPDLKVSTVFNKLSKELQMLDIELTARERQLATLALKHFLCDDLSSLRELNKQLQGKQSQFIHIYEALDKVLGDSGITISTDREGPRDARVTITCRDPYTSLILNTAGDASNPATRSPRTPAQRLHDMSTSVVENQFWHHGKPGEATDAMLRLVPTAAVATGLYLKPAFLHMQIPAQVQSELMVAAQKTHELLKSELTTVTNEMVAISKSHPIGTTPAEWRSGMFEGYRMPRTGYAANSNFVPLPVHESRVRLHWNNLINPAADAGVFLNEAIPVEGAGAIKSAVGRSHLGLLKVSPYASADLAGAMKEWNAVAAKHNEQLSRLRQVSGLHEVGAFAAGQGINKLLDIYAFGDTPSGTRTMIMDLGATALMFAPYGHPALRAAGMVGLHLTARLLDRLEQKYNDVPVDDTPSPIYWFP